MSPGKEGRKYKGPCRAENPLFLCIFWVGRIYEGGRRICEGGVGTEDQNTSGGEFKGLLGRFGPFKRARRFVLSACFFVLSAAKFVLSAAFLYCLRPFLYCLRYCLRALLYCLRLFCIVCGLVGGFFCIVCGFFCIVCGRFLYCRRGCGVLSSARAGP